jgi:hypothetical protein
LQSAAISSQKVDIWLLDIGQRAGNMVARQYCERMRSTQRSKCGGSKMNQLLCSAMCYLESLLPRARLVACKQLNQALESQEVVD